MMGEPFPKFPSMRVGKCRRLAFLDHAVEKAIGELEALVGTERRQLVDKGLVHASNVVPEGVGANGVTD